MTTVFVLASEPCTAANGTSINGFNSGCGFGGFENGTGLFALSASIQGNAIRKSNTIAGQTLHRFESTALPNDAVDYSWDLKRAPDTAAAFVQGFGFRGDGQQFSAGGANWIVLYIDRVSTTLVNLKFIVKAGGSIVQSGTITANLAWAESTARRLGVRLDGAVMQAWLADAVTGDNKANTGSPVTLTPSTLIAQFYYAGGFAQGAILNAEWDTGRLTADVDPTEAVQLSQSGSTVTVAWQDKSVLGTVTYDIAYTGDNGRTWTALATDDAGTPYSWNVAAIPPGLYRVRVRMGNTCQDSPSRVSAPFAVNLTANNL